MGKIRVEDLAKMMGIPHQDLVFKLRSIGVRVEGEEAGVDTDILQAILQGKKLAGPREVIMDDSTPPAPAGPAGARRGPAAPPAPGRPAAPGPMRPTRPRTLIQQVEPRIKTLPSTPGGDRMAAPPAALASGGSPVPAAIEAASAEVEAPSQPATPAAPAAPHRPAAPESAAPAAAAAPPVEAPRPAPPRRGAVLIHRPEDAPPPPSLTRPRSPSGPRPMGPGGRPMGPGARPGGPGVRPSGPSGYRPSGPGVRPSGPGGAYRPSGPSGPGGARPGGPRPLSVRPATPSPSARPGEGRRTAPGEGQDDKKKGKKGKKTTLPAGSGPDLHLFKGSLNDIEAVVDEAAVPTGAAHRRRRRDEERERAEERARLKPTKDPATAGPIVIGENMTVREFSDRLGVKAKDMIRLLFNRGILANINHIIEPELGVKLAEELGFQAKVMSFEQEVQARNQERPRIEGGTPRAPVVTIMGHVDHGKTSLLDKIRSSKITESEFGGITQHIGAYHVDVKGRQIVFLDTPGHEAFTLMRARGARVTDVVVLVVAADDGVMPQTLEAIDHARAANVPMVVALNKVDKPNANIDRVKQQLADKGLLPEDWGGQTVVVPVSAVKGTGIDELLDMILLTSDLLDLRADPDLPGQGTVLEARKETGRGVVATLLVQNGTLHVGDIFVSGATWGRARSMADDRGRRAQEAGPSTAVEVTGFNDVPEAGDSLQVVEEESKARSIVEFRQQEMRKRDLLPTQGRLSLEQLFSQIKEGEVKDLPIVLKADVQGSVEVLKETIEKVATTKVKVSVLHSGVGAISTNDVLLASASKAIIVGFNVRPERNATELAEKEAVEIRMYTVIYELLDDLKKAMTGLLDPTFKEVHKGRAEVREIFRVPKVGTIAGCHVVEGSIPRTAGIRLLRDNRVIFEGKISSLKRFKDDASEVRSGFDCGIGIERFQDVKPGDVIEAYVREEVAAVLS
jgi:translation initiation factor IF-2